MTERLLRFLQLTEITTVRLLCKNEGCKAIVEIPLEQLGQTKYKACLACGRPFGVTEHFDQVNHLRSFSEAVAALKKASDNLDMEFVLPAEPAGTPSP